MISFDDDPLITTRKNPAARDTTGFYQSLL
jgi:hypothetical protein